MPTRRFLPLQCPRRLSNPRSAQPCLPIVRLSVTSYLSHIIRLCLALSFLVLYNPLRKFDRPISPSTDVCYSSALPLFSTSTLYRAVRGPKAPANNLLTKPPRHRNQNVSSYLANSKLTTITSSNRWRVPKIGGSKSSTLSLHYLQPYPLHRHDTNFVDIRSCLLDRLYGRTSIDV